MKAVSIVALALVSSSAFAASHLCGESPNKLIQAVEITDVECPKGDGIVTVHENSGPVKYKIDNAICNNLKNKYAFVLKCTSVRADIYVKDNTYAGGLLGSKEITELKKTEPRQGTCL